MITDKEILKAFDGRSMLVIDDEKFTRSILDRQLSPLTLVEAGDGALGLHKYRADRGIAMIICDFNMPVMDGLRFLKAIRADCPAPRNAIPVLMLTGSADSSLVRLALDLDVDGFILKPVSQHTLETRIKHALSQNRDIKQPKYYAAIDVDGVSEKLLGSADPLCTPEEIEQAKKAAEQQAHVGIKLRLDHLNPGVVLSEDIRAPTGELLIATGVPLTERLIRRLMELSPLGIVPGHVWVTG